MGFLKSTGWAFPRHCPTEEVSKLCSRAIIASIMSLAPGQKLGPYEVVSPIGAGGMGEVYRATDTRLDRIVALKILPKEFSCDPVRKQRFEQEAKTISSLNHPHLRVARHWSPGRGRFSGDGMRRGRDARQAAGKRPSSYGTGAEVRCADCGRAG